MGDKNLCESLDMADSASYLAQHSLEVYLSDLAALLVREQNSSPANALKICAQYFDNVNKGTHILLREFSYVNATPKNRAAFLATARDAYRNTGQQVINGTHEVTGLLQLLCPDFPHALTEKAYRTYFASATTTDENAHQSRQEIKLGDALRVTLLNFYFAEFFNRATEVFSTCDTRSSGVVNRNVLMLTLQQMMRSQGGHRLVTYPPSDVFDELVHSCGRKTDVTLEEILSILQDTRAMRGFYDTCSTFSVDSQLPHHSPWFKAALRQLDPPSDLPDSNTAVVSSSAPQQRRARRTYRSAAGRMRRGSR